MEFTAYQIADFLQGTIEGNPNVKINDFAKIEEGRAGTLCFLANPKYNNYIYDTQATIILVNKDFVAEKPVSATLIRVENAYEAVAKLLAFYEKHTEKALTGISQLAFVAPTAKVGKNAYIEQFVVIGEGVEIGDNAKIFARGTISENVKIGDNATIFSGVSIYKDCIIGNNCTLHSGVVIGADGFGFVPTDDGTYKKIPQLGNVIIEDDVEIGANSTIDRATMGSTVIRKGVKLDNLVQIAHNVDIGENTVIAAQSGIAGSTKTGKNCMFAGQVGIAGHLTVADGTKLGAQTGVAGSIKTPNTIYQGTPAVPVGIFRRSSVVYKSLPEMQNTIIQLEKRIKNLEEKLYKN
ncbi:MAG: UDP-3-O-(3-hydroxymyristoyl)glucosamine N-acyltransferase [Prevotellaceae bacterium]|jgi:UDP-3-O-[3-hydroxymyristoyl] glucosamine N-acyltransferase|nr:UDP-3-O-(3-hydroxymyristoyl)glucosamine N-acyltransferase [Prevotellaceae bacterium]